MYQQRGKEAKMDHTKQFMHDTFFQKSQVAIIFQIKAELIDTLPKGPFRQKDPTIFVKQEMVPSTNKDDLMKFLKGQNFTLTEFSPQHTLRRPGDPPPDNPLLIGKYLFRSRDQGKDIPTVISFFHFTEDGVPQPAAADATSEMPIPEAGNAHGDQDHDDHNPKGGHTPDPTQDPVARLVNLINANLDGEWNKKAGTIPVVAASPVWLSGATQAGPLPQGCPAIPPIPVPADASCSSAPGLWPITLQGLSHDMETMTGEGVTVFILDTLPSSGEIKRAAEAAEENNLLLLDVAYNVKLDYHILPDILDLPGPDQPATGKDIMGRDIGFRMPDHGLFIAGIVRDLAPSVRVESMRILNDWCVGDMTTYIKALEEIHDRMSRIDPNSLKDGDPGKAGDLYQKPVVINMSLNATPSPKEAESFGLSEKVIRDSLLPFLQSLVNLGAVFVASAGNEADTRIWARAMDPSGTRPGPVLPGALAGDLTPSEMICVGAVDSKGNPTSYSCYPGPNGIATYGGEVPKPADKKSPDGMTMATDIDALIGIYSSMSYPALSLDDPHSRYPVPNTSGWAYWVGTSFATPIIAAVAARVQELKLRGIVPPTTSVAQYVINTVASAQPQVYWTRLQSSISSSETATGRMIKAVQCHPTVHEKKGEGTEKVKVSIELDGRG
jgi:hypothetical protein